VPKVIPAEQIARSVLVLRGQRVLIRLTAAEWAALRSQFVTLKQP
jgi:hypothetical protein